MNEEIITYPERIKKNIEIYQFNQEGSDFVNKRYEEIKDMSNLKEISIHLYPKKRPNSYILKWEIYVRR